MEINNHEDVHGDVWHSCDQCDYNSVHGDMWHSCDQCEEMTSVQLVNL